MAHKTWTNEDLRAWMIQVDFEGYEDKAHFGSVVYNGAFVTVSFIQKKAGTPGSEADRPSYAVVISHRVFEMAHGRGLWAAGYKEEATLIKALTKDEGNRLWKEINATKKTSKKGFFYYDLGAALDRIPKNTVLYNKFVGA